MALQEFLVETLPLISRPMDLIAFPVAIGGGLVAIYILNPDLRPYFHRGYLDKLSTKVNIPALGGNGGKSFNVTGDEEIYDEEELQEKVEEVSDTSIDSEQLMKEIGMIENLARGIGKEEERMKGADSDQLKNQVQLSMLASVITALIVLWQLVL